MLFHSFLPTLPHIFLHSTYLGVSLTPVGVLTALKAHHNLKISMPARCSVLNLVLSFSINLTLVSHSGQLFSCLLKIPISVVLFEVCSNLKFLKSLWKESKEEILGMKVTKTYGFFLALTSVLL